MIKTDPNIDKVLTKVDLMIFDIDGVLINTGPSFIFTIITTAKFYINKYLSLNINLEKLCIEDAYEFKNYSGFNNDWNLTTSLIKYIILTEYSENTIDRKELLKSVESLGGGREGIDRYLAKYIDPKISGFINDKVKHDIVKRIFQEFYAGTKYCRNLYGFDPEFYTGENGSIMNEEILLENELLSKWNGKIGVLTGRAKNETGLALETLNIPGLDNDLVEYSDDLLPDKPDPQKMKKIIIRSNCSSILYLGDTLDDYLTVENFNNSNNDRELVFGLVRSNGILLPEKAKRFSASSVNDLLSHVLKCQTINSI